MSLIKFIRPFYKRNLSDYFAKRRLHFINGLSGNFIFDIHPKQIKILEIGCNIGEDFIKHLNNRDDLEIYGLDLEDYGLRQKNFKMIVGDAVQIDFPNKFFDFAISLGVLEHIQPIEKLSEVITEINRVSKSFYHDVPAINTFVESHTNSFFWQLRDHNKKTPYGALNYFSDEAWLQFIGFHDAKVKRFSYIPFGKKDLIIYKN